MFTDGLVHDIDYFIDQFSPIEVTQQSFPEEKGKGLFYFTGNLKIDKNTEQIEYYYYSDDNFTQTYDHETLPVVRDGISTVNVKEYYARSESKTVVPGSSEWSTVPPEFTGKNKYLWNYEVTILSDGTKITTDPAVISENGKGIKAITEYYAVSNSATTAPTEWSTSPISVSTSNKYLWNYEVVTYDDDTITQTQPAIIGTYGEKGEKGDPGKDGQDGDDGTDGLRGSQYLGGFYSAPYTRVPGDTYLNYSDYKLYIWNTDWTPIDDINDPHYWDAMGDMIRAAAQTHQQILAANAWIDKLVAGTILSDEIKTKILTADNIKAVSGVFQNITVTGSVWGYRVCSAVFKAPKNIDAYSFLGEVWHHVENIASASGGSVQLKPIIATGGLFIQDKIDASKSVSFTIGSVWVGYIAGSSTEVLNVEGIEEVSHSLIRCQIDYGNIDAVINVWRDNVYSAQFIGTESYISGYITI